MYVFAHTFHSRSCLSFQAGTFSPGDNSHTVIYIPGDDCHNSFTVETYVIHFIGYAPAQESWQSRPSVNSKSHCMQADDTTTLPICRLWTGLGCSFCLRITHLCPYNLQDLQD